MDELLESVLDLVEAGVKGGKELIKKKKGVSMTQNFVQGNQASATYTNNENMSTQQNKQQDMQKNPDINIPEIPDENVKNAFREAIKDYKETDSNLDFRNLSRNDLINGMKMSIILDKPLAYKNMRNGNRFKK